MALTDSVTAAMVSQLRRMVNEPSTDTYDDDSLKTYIATYPLLDERGEQPYTWDTTSSPPTKDINEDWVATFDLHAAAADIWEEKAAVVAVDFDFSADGGSYTRSQVYEQYMKQARYHRGKRSARTTTLHKWPQETGLTRLTNVVNQVKKDDEWPS